MPIFPSGKYSCFVAEPSIKSTSKVFIEFIENPGKQMGAGSVKWIELFPKVGFTVHLNTVCQDHTEFLYVVLPLSLRVNYWDRDEATNSLYPINLGDGLILRRDDGLNSIIFNSDGIIYYENRPDFVLDTQIVDKKYVDEATAGAGEKGDTGVPGEKGDTGVPGSSADKGDTGDQGDTGIIFVGTEPPEEFEEGTLWWDVDDSGGFTDKGDTGVRGDTGESGFKGDTGDRGDNILYINRQVSDYTLRSIDANSLVEMSLPFQGNLKVPNNSDVGFPVGTVVKVFQKGVGQVFIVGDVGVSINSRLGNRLAGQYSWATLIKTDVDVWYLIGDVVT